MTFKCRFNATCFLFKINRFVLIFSKTSNRFVLKICSGGFADYRKSEIDFRVQYFLLPMQRISSSRKISSTSFSFNVLSIR